MKIQNQNRYAKHREGYVAIGTHTTGGGCGWVNWYRHFGKLFGITY